MIAFVRVACVRPGKQVAAAAFAKDMAAFLKGSYQLDMELLRPVGGNPHRIAWSTRYPDMATMDAVSTRMLADPHYWERLNSASDCFIAGATRDAIWQTV